MSEVNEKEQPLSLAAETMHGDLMAMIIDELRAAPDVWQRLAEAEQDQIIERVRNRTGEAIEECVRMIATQGFTRIRATIDSITIKDGIKAVLTMPSADPARHELTDAQGSRVYVVIANTEAFGGGAHDVKPEPDQGALVLGAIDKIGKNARDNSGKGEA